MANAPFKFKLPPADGSVKRTRAVRALPRGQPPSTAAEPSWSSSIYRPASPPTANPEETKVSGQRRKFDEESPASIVSNIEDADGESRPGVPRRLICAPCRSFRKRCTGGQPCDGCVLRNRHEECVTGHTSRYTLRVGGDAEALQDQLTRLQALVERLTSQRTPPAPSSVSSGRDSPIGSARSFDRSSVTPSATSTLDQFEPPPYSEEVDLQANDLVEALSQLTVSSFISPDSAASFGRQSYAPDGTSSGADFVQEADNYLATFASRMGIADEPHFATNVASSPFSAIPSASTLLLPSTVQDEISLLALIPSHEDAQPLLDRFFTVMHWFYRPIVISSFYKAYEEFQQARICASFQSKIDWSFCAVLLMICSSSWRYFAFDGPISKEELERRTTRCSKMAEGAMLALRLAKFTSQPTLNGIQAIVMMATNGIFFSPGDGITACVGLLALAIQSAFSMGLHRDPQRLGAPAIDFLEAESRRRTFWALFYVSSKTNWVYSLQDGSFNLSQIDCELPLDCDDDELLLEEDEARSRMLERVLEPRPTDMSPLICKYKIAKLMKKCADTAFSLDPVTYDTTLALHEELVAFEDSLPYYYRVDVDATGSLLPSPYEWSTRDRGIINVTLAAAIVRVHRPWIVLAASDARYSLSRTTSVRYARLLLQIVFSSPFSTVHWSAQNYKIINCAIILSIELLQSSRADPQLEALIQQAITSVSESAQASAICRKGAAILRFLMSKLEEAQTDEPKGKRSRRDPTQVAERGKERLRAVFDSPKLDESKGEREGEQRRKLKDWGWDVV